MPLSSAVFARSFIHKEEALITNVFIPNFAVLFYYDEVKNWVNTPSGTLDLDYYSNLVHKLIPAGVDLTTFQWPLIKSVDAYDSDTFTMSTIPPSLGGSAYTPMTVTSDMTTLATLFETNGTHNPTSKPAFSKRPISFGSKLGDTLSKSTYIPRTNSDGGHVHHVLGTDLQTIIENKVINGNKFANQNINYESLSVPQLAILPVMRDPNLGNPDKILNYLPKNVIVFGQNITDSNYSRTDINHPSISTTTNGTGNINDPVPVNANAYNISVNGSNLGTFYYNNLQLKLQTDIAGLHSHNAVVGKVPNYLSTASNQTAIILNDAGNHSHIVYYNTSLYLKTKKLMSYITTNDNTPIANGVIIGYFPSNALGFSGDITKLPANWHFCDGSNGTPDLTSYYIGAGFNDTDNDIDISKANDGNGNDLTVINIDTIVMQANGAHSHAINNPVNGSTILGTALDIGGHSDGDLEKTVTDHVHTVSTRNSFNWPTLTDAKANLNLNSKINVIPPTFQMGFIMYNNLIA